MYAKNRTHTEKRGPITGPERAIGGNSGRDTLSGHNPTKGNILTLSLCEFSREVEDLGIVSITRREDTRGLYSFYLKGIYRYSIVLADSFRSIDGVTLRREARGH